VAKNSAQPNRFITSQGANNGGMDTSMLETSMCKTTIKAFTETGAALILAPLSMVICISIVALTTATSYAMVKLIQGRHRTPDSQTTTTTPTNVISVQSSVQIGTRPLVQHTDPLTAIEPYQLANNLGVWWARLELCLEDTPTGKWARKALMHIDEKVLVRLGGNVRRYADTTDGFKQLHQDLEKLTTTTKETAPAANCIIELNLRRQKRHESAEDYGRALKILANQCGKIDEKALGNLFFIGLNDKELRKEVSRHMHTTGFANLEEMASYAKHMEQGWSTAEECMRDRHLEQEVLQRRQITGTSGTRNFPRQDSYQSSAPLFLNGGIRQNNYQAYQKPLYNGETSHASRTPENKDQIIQCHQCGNQGHRQRNCPEQAQNQE